MAYAYLTRESPLLALPAFGRSEGFPVDSHFERPGSPMGSGPVFHRKLRPSVTFNGNKYLVPNSGNLSEDYYHPSWVYNFTIERFDVQGSTYRYLSVGGKSPNGSSISYLSGAHLYVWELSPDILDPSKVPEFKIFAQHYSMDSIFQAAVRVSGTPSLLYSYAMGLDLTTYAYHDATNIIGGVARYNNDAQVAYPAESDITSGVPAYSDFIAGANGLGVLMSPGCKRSVELAFYDMIERLPQSSVNLLEAAADLIDGVKDIFSFALNPCKVGELLSFSGKDAWFGYRYSFSTSLSDLQDLWSTYRRRADIASSGAKTISAYGRYGDYRCSANIGTDSLLGDDFGKIEQFFGSVSLYDVWDLVPYSWVVDWVLPISDILHGWELYSYACRLDLSDMWCSYKASNSQGSVYYRLPLMSVPSNCPLELSSVGSFTFMKRTIDAIMLLR